MSGSPYFVYVIRCADGSLYSGITTDVVRRMREHRSKSTAAARYTRAHGAVGLEGLWRCEGRSLASKLEWRLHHMTRAQKLALLASPGEAGEEYEPVAEAEREGIWGRSSGSPSSE